MSAPPPSHYATPSQEDIALAQAAVERIHRYTHDWGMEFVNWGLYSLFLLFYWILRARDISPGILITLFAFWWGWQAFRRSRQRTRFLEDKKLLMKLRFRFGDVFEPLMARTSHA